LFLRSFRAALLAALLVLAPATTALAEPNQPPTSGAPAESDWQVSLITFGMYAPRYEGADDSRLLAFPMLDVSWRDRFFFGMKGLGATLWRNEQVDVALALGYSFGRDENDSPDLAGLGDIDAGASANLHLGYNARPFSYSLHLERPLGDRDTGAQLHLGIGYDLSFGRRLMLKPGLKTTWANARSMQSYFGVTPSQSISSGLPVYEAGAGFKSAGLNLLAIYLMNRHWAGTVTLGADRLLGDAADSPITQDRTQFSAGAGLSYRF